MILVDEMMTPDPVVVRRDTSIAECAAKMSRRAHRHLPVVDDDGVLVGMVTDFDVFSRGGLVGALWVPFDDGGESLAAGDVAQRVHVMAERDASLETAVQDMLASPQDFFVVVDDERHPIGIFTEHDGVRMAQGDLTSEVDAAHIGSKPVRAVQAKDSAHAAWLIIMQYRVRHVVVVDKGRVVGVISVRDLIEDDIPRGRQLTCEEVLRREAVLTVPEGMPLARVAALMVDTRMGCLPVTDEDGKPVAVITRTDLIEAVLSAMQQEQLFE